MPQVSLNNISIRYGSNPILDKAELHIEDGERICLIGRNGCGKSTLMKIILGECKPDAGEVSILKQCKLAYLPQDVPMDAQGSVFQVITQRLDKDGALLEECRKLSSADSLSADEDQRLNELHQIFDEEGLWNLQAEVEQAVKRLGLNVDDDFNALSAGRKRRVILEAALLAKTNVLLLDEPTNHLDIESIELLEEQIRQFKGAILFVTHDRVFLKKVATRIIEIDRGILRSWNCSYDDYLVRKKELLAGEASQNAQFDKKLAQEEVWIRQGILARRTRNEGRVRALKKLREIRAQRINQVGTAKIKMEQGQTSGVKVIEVDKLNFKYNEDTIVDNLSTTIFRGDKLGLIGNNGCGKTTLIKLLLKQLSPQEGLVKHGTNLEIAYFDQLRRQLNPELTVAQNINPNGDTIKLLGRNVHVLSYLQDFLFTPDRSRCKVQVMSGGEQNRLLLAKLFSEPFNLLVLDEPTNDLDTETLELLEEKLIEYEGTLILVSHDRAFLNNVATQCLAFEGNGSIRESVGGYDDWKAYCERNKTSTTPPTQPKGTKPKTEKNKKLSFKEKHELEELPKKIEALESEQTDLNEKLNDPELYKDANNKAQEYNNRIQEIEEELEIAYERWDELEEKASD